MTYRPDARRTMTLILLLTVAATLTAQQPGTNRSASLVPAPIGPNGQVRNLYAGSYALLVGESRYDARAAWPALDSVPGELNNLSVALRDLGFSDVQIVMNPTGEELLRAVLRFIGQYGYDRDNRLFFYFSGHGYTLDSGQRGYFVPRDAPNPRADEAGFRRVALSMQQIATWAGEIVAKHALFAFDSCFSGTIFRSRGPGDLPQHLSAITAKPVREFLTAGSAGETVPAKSVFAPMIVRGLRGGADIDHDGFVTGTELGNYVQREVISYRTNQTPQFGKMRDPNYDEGDVVFLVPPGPAVTPAVKAPPAPAPVAALPSLPAAVIEQPRSGQSVPVQILDMVSKSLPEMVWLTDLEQKGNDIIIQGRSTTLASLSDFIGNLERSPLLVKPIEIVNSTIETVGATGAPTGGGAGIDLIKFTVKAKLAPNVGKAPAAGGAR